jgi:glycosyltransferase involved in cell wall biosynthesis
VHVPNGIDPVEWEEQTPVDLPQAHAHAIRVARQRGRLLVAYAGAHGIANALGTLLDAAALSRDDSVTWLLIGAGPEKAALQQRVTAERLDNVVMLDAVPKAVIPSLLRAMDVLYIGLQSQPLFRFGISPNKLMDYIMAARPVVCAIAAGNDPVGDSGCGVTVPPDSAQAVVGAIRRLASLSSDERLAMGLRGRDFVLAHHTYPVLARRFIEAIQSHGH